MSFYIQIQEVGGGRSVAGKEGKSAPQEQRARS